ALRRSDAREGVPVSHVPHRHLRSLDGNGARQAVTLRRWGARNGAAGIAGGGGGLGVGVSNQHAAGGVGDRRGRRPERLSGSEGGAPRAYPHPRTGATRCWSACCAHMTSRLVLRIAFVLALALAIPGAARADWDDRPDPGEFEESLAPDGYWA